MFFACFQHVFGRFPSCFPCPVYPPGVSILITRPPPSTVPEDGGPLMACIQIAGMGVVLQRPVMIRLRTEDGTAIGTFHWPIEDFMMRVSSQ